MQRRQHTYGVAWNSAVRAKLFWISLAAVVCFPWAIGSMCQAQTASSSAAGSALATMFSPVHAPPRKTMGLLQRSFVDAATQSGGTLEVALVVDGTDSMATELSGVRESIHRMLDDLSRCRDEVRVAMVIYRDSLSPSGETRILLKNFTTDRVAIEEAVKQLQPESGQPFFHELADVGLHAALTKLPWSEDPAVTRWLLWFGDAPPYANSFRDESYPASRRRYANELLTSVASRKNIQINAVLCSSSDNVAESHEKTIDQTRRFINELVAGTDGLMLDLSYPDIRAAIAKAGKRPSLEYTEIAPITTQDLQQTGGVAQQRTKPVSIAVLPHQPLGQVSFDPTLKTVQVATALRHQLSQIPGIRVASPMDVQRQLMRLRVEGIPDTEQIRGLSARLGVDYVVWGEVEPSSMVRTAAYRRTDGHPVFQVASEKHAGENAKVFIRAVANTDVATSDQDDDAANVIDALSERVQGGLMTAQLGGQIADSSAAQSEILAAIESLDQNLAMEVGSEQSTGRLTIAQSSIESALKTEPQNPRAHWLAANIAMNQANALYTSGETQAANEAMTRMRASLRRAHRNRSRNVTPSLRIEIEADELLLIQQNFADAITKYQSLLGDKNPLASQLRAHWMLAGLRAGDWGVADEAPKLVDATSVRKHLIAILSRWPQSPQAEFVRRWLRWDDVSGRSRFHHFPKANASLASLGN